MQQVIVEKNERGLGKIFLNRPEALNALNFDMIKIIRETLEKWRDDHTVKLILLTSTNERAFSAGGDIKALYEAKTSGQSMSDAAHFFSLEYELDEMVYTYDKPIIANLNGIVMGGGVGLTYGADYKIVTENTRWAMPEMNISLFPDVGASYFLNKAPGFIGRYVALTAKTFTAADIIYMNAANIYMESIQLNKLLSAIEETNWFNHTVNNLENIIERFKTPLNRESTLERNSKLINKHFSYNTVEEIIDSLQRDDSAFSKNTMKLLLTLSPLSLKVTLELLRRGEDCNIHECLQTDLIVAKHFMEQHDFYEGVRSVLIDKDRQPNYEHKSLEDVPNSLVESFFN